MTLFSVSGGTVLVTPGDPMERVVVRVAESGLAYRTRTGKVEDKIDSLL